MNKTLLVSGTIFCLSLVLGPRTYSAVLSGADLLALEGAGVEFPTVDPTLNGTSLVFGAGSTFDKLLVYELDTGLTFSFVVDITRLTSIDDPTDSDPHFLLTDGSQMFGISYADNDGGKLIEAGLRDDGAVGSNRDAFITLVLGIGYPAVGESVSLNLDFLLSATNTTVQASVFNQTASYTWNQALSPDSLAFVLLRDNDPGERYQINSLTVPDGTQSVAIDIKPGSDPNCFNINGNGVVPVAILGSDSFEISMVDQNTLSFGGLTVRMRGNKGPLCGLDDVNTDGFYDLVCRFDDDVSNWSPGDGEATLTGELLDGTPIEGTDSICVVPRRAR